MQLSLLSRFIYKPTQVEKESAMTHSAGQRGYKASAAAASKDDELYGVYNHGKEEWPEPKGFSTRRPGPRQSADRALGNMAGEPMDRRNR